MPKFYITTPLYYVNSKPHIGHSYTQIACDTVSRFMRQAGYEVFFMTGTDEHGEKIEKATLERGYKLGEEKIFVDEIVPTFKDLWKRLNIKYDHFIRTTDSEHEKCVQAVLQRLNENGKIYKKVYKGWFCTPCETFWSEVQAPDGICPDCRRPVEKLDEENYFLKLSEYQSWLIEYIKAHPDFIKPDFRRNEVLGFLNRPLLDLCISRPKSRMAWGVEIPFDKYFVTYVWFDALINYISGVGYPHNMARFKKYWPADFHVIGKDILRHHAVYWPIILRALDIEPPKTIFAHGWWVVKGEKMSKSKGNIVDPIEIVSQYGVDPYRYFLLREVPFGLDGTFSEEALVNRYNSDLANDLGNLLNRTLTMVEKYFEGNIPGTRPPRQGLEAGRGNHPLTLRQKLRVVLSKVEGRLRSGWFRERKRSETRRNEGLRSKAIGLADELEKTIPQFDFASALTKIWEVINLANKYIEDSKPWSLAKEKKMDELTSTIYTLLEVLKTIANAIHPFMPLTAENVCEQLGIEISGELRGGIKINKLKPLFPRIEIS